MDFGMTSHHLAPFDAGQLRSLQIAARISSCFSLAGSSFTIISFLCYYPLRRKPVNRLAITIAIANFFACLAYSWAQSPVRHGRHSAWCQTQGFLLTWFLMTDPLLVMIMAFNVFLTVRTKRNVSELKKLDLAAVALAFILPLIPASVYLYWRPNGKTVYGPATTWCWIAQESAALRISAFFGPIWSFLAVALCCFALSGKQIWRVRNKVKAAKAEWMLESARRDRGRSMPDGPGSLPQGRRLSTLRAFLTPSTTQDSELTVVLEQTGSQVQRGSTTAQLKLFEPLVPIPSHDCLLDHGIERVTERNSSIESPPLSPFSSRPQTLQNFPAPTNLERSASDQMMLQHTQPPTQQQSARRTSSRFDRLHWKYAKFAILCTVVVFVTWVPISVARVVNLVYPDKQIYGLYIASAVSVPLHGFGNFLIYLTVNWSECVDFLTCKTRKTARNGSSSAMDSRDRNENPTWTKKFRI